MENWMEHDGYTSLQFRGDMLYKKTRLEKQIKQFDL